jgi:hypothetical protein
MGLYWYILFINIWLNIMMFMCVKKLCIIVVFLYKTHDKFEVIQKIKVITL